MLVEDNCVFEVEMDLPSDKEEMRLVFGDNQAGAGFLHRVNKYHPKSYYYWTYCLQLVKDILMPLIHRVPTLQETLLVNEVMTMQYVSS